MMNIADESVGQAAPYYHDRVHNPARSTAAGATRRDGIGGAPWHS
jgi:hypothetical protein